MRGTALDKLIECIKKWGTLVRRVPRRGRITEKDVKFLDPKHEPVNPRRSINAFLSVHGQKEG